MTARPALVDATVASLHLRTAHGVEVRPATVRDWARRGLIARHGERDRFDLREIVAVARTRGLIT